MPFNVRKRAYK